VAVVGRVLLILGLTSAVYGLVASVYGGRTGRREFVDSGRRAMYVLFGLAVFCFVILDVAFISSNFSYVIVANGSSTTTPLLYRAAAVWATQQGSLLLWVMLLSGWSSLALLLTRRRVREIVPYAQATLFGLATFFTALTTLFANPFTTTAAPPAEGAGLDPLLRHATMMIHPPMLYSGYTLMMVPFAFAVGALISGRLGAEWIAVTRRFALAAWLALGIGILLGARWSYTELGWGGYWAWDPVENAALMPWLCTTAFIHSIMIQEKRGMLKVWNASLVLAAGCLAVIGTFLVRSGILSSIHAFVSDPTLNVTFVTLISVMVIGSVGLVTWRRDRLRSDAQIDSLLSREAMFLFQNLVLVALTAVVFWITFFPLISEAITGTEVSVGPPAFTPFVVPLALVIVALAGIGPIIPWRRVTASKLRHGFAGPLGFGLVVFAAVGLLGGVTGHLFAWLMFGLGAFVVATVAQEFWRGTRARQATTGGSPPRALGALVRRNRRRYGGYIVHLGIAVALIGVAGSTSFQHQRTAALMPGQSFRTDGYVVRYVRPTASATAEKISFGAVLDVSKGGRHVTTLDTAYGLYPAPDPFHPIGRFFNGSAESQVGLDSGPLRDLWVVVAPNVTPLDHLINQGDVYLSRAILAAQRMPQPQQTQQLNIIYGLRDQLIQALARRFVTHPWTTQFRFEVSPLVMWLWLGAIVAALGGLISLWPVPRRRRVRVPATAPAVPAPTTAPAPPAPAGVR
jgi:cytochrome c-type biogenesis protein CcmF